MQLLVLQIDPIIHWLVVIQRQNEFDYFIASDCNSPIGMMSYVDITLFISFTFHFLNRNKSWMMCYNVDFCCSIVFIIFIGTFFQFSFRVSWVQFSVSWLETTSYRNYPSIQSSPASVEDLPVSEWLSFIRVSRDQWGVKFCILVLSTRKDHNHFVAASQLISFNSKFACIERRVLFERWPFKRVNV
jgi:hypothetical protein